MPTLDNPTHYERASFIAPNRYDSFLRWGNMAYEAETSTVECPLGWVGLLKLDWEPIDTYCASTPTDSWPVGIEPGWYIVRVDEHGFVFGIGYGGYCAEHKAFCADTSAEEAARADFAEAEQAYAAWDSE